MGASDGRSGVVPRSNASCTVKGRCPSSKFLEHFHSLFFLRSKRGDADALGLPSGIFPRPRCGRCPLLKTSVVPSAEGAPTQEGTEKLAAEELVNSGSITARNPSPAEAREMATEHIKELEDKKMS